MERKHSNVVVDISRCITLENVVYDWRGQGKNRKPKYKTKRYYLPFKQETERGIRLADTDPVNAEIMFYDQSCNVLWDLSKGPAFWYNDKPRAKKSNRRDNDLIIKKSGEVEGVGLIIKQVGKPSFYAFNHNSYVPGTGDFQFDKSMKIGPGFVYAHVHIADGNFERDDWVKITKQLRREHPLFELVDSPLHKGDKKS